VAVGLREMNTPAPDRAASLPDTATTLAFERTRIAYDRTMMAWIRTATSLITFGFSVYKFFQFELKSAPAEQMLVGPRGFGIALIAAGLLSMLVGMVEHARDMRSLRRQYVGMPKSYTSIVAVVVGVLGLFALVAVVLRA
jgi:putative membrane protein